VTELNHAQLRADIDDLRWILDDPRPSRLCQLAATAEILLNQLEAVQAVLEGAKRVSSSPSMMVYVADVERALGLDVARPHKLG